jgi:RNA polymerase sigma-70 factor, ECF subfamily
VNPRQLSPSGEALSREERELFNRAMERLPDSYRQAIELRHREDLSFEKLGERLNRSEEAARKLWTRAVRQLQQELGIDGKQRIPAKREPA